MSTRYRPSTPTESVELYSMELEDAERDPDVQYNHCAVCRCELEYDADDQEYCAAHKPQEDEDEQS